MEITDAQLEQLLTELEYLPKSDIEKAQKLAKSEHISLSDALLRSELLSDDNLGKLFAYSYQVPFVSLSQLTIAEAALHITPKPVATKHRVITFDVSDDVLKLATSDPTKVDLFSMLAKKAGVKEYKVLFATDRDIEDALRQYRKQLESAFEELLGNKDTATNDLPVARIVDTIIEYSYVSKASDVHIEPTRTSSIIRFRIDGILHDVVRLPKELHLQVVTRIKVLARLRTDEHFSAQDGRMRTLVEEDKLDIRVSIVPIVTGEKAVLRLLASHTRQIGLTDLGMGQTDLDKVRHGFSRPYGMVLSTGPTGSGKTTSMYSILKILNIREKNIATVEDPVEYEVDGINQIQVNTKTNLTFANGLRSILRQDPDIIFVGEIRDQETADIAINSAMTGHLVLSTLHTNDAATALPRLIDMGIEPFLVASSVNTIIAQRLVRRICDRCKLSFELIKEKKGWTGEPKLVSQLTSFSDEILEKHFGKGNSIRVYQGKGCSACHNTGYIGRVGVFEVLEVTPAIQKMITTKASAEQVMQQAIKEGMATMLDDAMNKVLGGTTTLEEVMRATRE